MYIGLFEMGFKFILRERIIIEINFMSNNVNNATIVIEKQLSLKRT